MNFDEFWDVEVNGQKKLNILFWSHLLFHCFKKKNEETLYFTKVTEKSVVVEDLLILTPYGQ